MGGGWDEKAGKGVREREFSIRAQCNGTVQQEVSLCKCSKPLEKVAA